jgi:SPP1 family predicted phage head-tail adaptor
MAYRDRENINAGDMTRQISLDAPTYNTGGDEISGYTPVITDLWAEKRTMRGQEKDEAGRTVSVDYDLYRIRYRSGIDSVKRLRDGSQVYDIQRVDNVNGRNRVIELTCKVVL